MNTSFPKGNGARVKKMCSSSEDLRISSFLICDRCLRGRTKDLSRQMVVLVSVGAAV